MAYETEMSGVVLEQKELEILLVEQGYEKGIYGGYFKSGYPSFYESMFEFCGKEIDLIWMFEYVSQVNCVLNACWRKEWFSKINNEVK